MSENRPLVSAEEIQAQYANMEKVRAFGGGKYHIITYGCQMNVRDSQTLAGMLETMGYEQVDEKENADVILFNTCCIRDNAERKVFGNVGHLRPQKRKNPNLVIGVCGCMPQQEGVAQRLRKTAPFVDVIFGTHNLHRFPEMMLKTLHERKGLVDIETDPFGHIAEGLPVRYDGNTQAFVNIMLGCNNFCTYCIVPYVRGRERSRNAGDIVREVEKLAGRGVKEITLLGQNVNSYAPESGEKFPDLLRRLDGLVPRIRFMTSHPKDLSDELIEVMASSASVCPQVHLPVQSGSDKILEAMNRRYTTAHYISIVEKLRAAMPDVGLTTDFIAGFPGESDADFEETMALARHCKFDSAFTFIYSPRQGTKAAQMENQVPSQLQHERLSRLIAQQEEITKQQLGRALGRVYPVLVESMSKRNEGFVTGRTDTGLTANMPKQDMQIGDIVQVRMQSIAQNTLKGEKV